MSAAPATGGLLGLLLCWLCWASAASADGVVPPPGSLPGDGAALASYLEERDHVAVVELSGNYDSFVEDDVVNAYPRALVAREFLSRHPDQYDFLIVFSTFEFDTGEALARHLGVRNDVQGIGRELFDSSDLFGSGGRLQGYVDMAALSRHQTDPLDASFEDTLAILAHEILHQWGAYVRYRRPDGTLSNALLGKQGSHWSFLLDSDASVQYGNDWHDNGDGTFTAVAATRFFSPLDLYLGGFLAAEEVPPLLLIENPAVDPLQLPRRGARIQGTATQVSIEDIIAAEGPRVPAAAESQRQFRAAFVLLVRPGEEASPSQIAALERIREALPTRFAILTGGRGLLEVYPEAMPAGARGMPGEVPRGPLREDEANLLDGLTWLRSRQAAAGYWEDRTATRTRDTGLALTTLARLDAQFTGEAGAISWLQGSPVGTTDSLARTAQALLERGRDTSAAAAALIALQNADGGWGLGPGYASDPLDTALALQALAGGAGASVAARDAGIAYLVASRGPDGGWGSSAGGPGRTGVTTTVLRALEALGRSDGVAAGATTFLASRQNPDGGFGDSPSTVHDTANALQALMGMDAIGSVDATEAIAFLRARQTLDGSWEGSVYATALAVDTLRRAGFPNWRFAAAPVVEPPAPRDGERVRLVFRVLNDGNVESPAGTLSLFVGDPSAGGAIVGEAELPPLAPRQAVDVTLWWDSLDHPGSNALFAVLDPEAKVEELSELDNRAVADVEVAAAPAGADLEVSARDLAISPAFPSELPTTLAIAAIVRNLGRADAAAVRMRLLMVPPGGGVADAVPVGEATMSVGQRSSMPVHFTVLLETAGTSTFLLRVDPDGEIAEANEANNEALVTVTTTAAVDLAVSADELVVEGTPTPGSDVTFRVELRNRGTIESPDADVRVTVSDGATTRELSTAAVRIPAGGAVERAIPWRVDLAGDLVLAVEVDPAGEVTESDETNNRAAVPLSTEAPDLPNLTVAFEDLHFVPDPGREGAPLEVSLLVRNTGGGDAAGVEFGFYEGDPAQGAPLLQPLVALPVVPAGAAQTATIALAALAGAADRLVFGVVDPAGAIVELDEDDNAAFRTLEVLAVPDLAVSPSAIALVPALPEAGQQVTTTITVANLGEQEARDVGVRLAVDGTPVGADIVLPSIPPAGSANAVFTWVFPAAADAVRLAVAVDPAGAVDEGNEGNNTAEREAAAFDPNQAVSNPYFSPNGDGVKDITIYSFTLAAPATVSVEAVGANGELVRRAALGETVKGRFEWDGRGDDGVVVRDGDYRLRVVAAGGGLLEEVPVTVDTDRWPLLAALGTPFERFTNLTCAVPGGAFFQVTADASEAFFVGGGGLYRARGSGGSADLVFPTTSFGFLEYLTVSDDGQKTANGEWGTNSSMAVSNMDGSDRRTVEWVEEVSSANVTFRPGTQEVVYLKRYPNGTTINYGIHAWRLDDSGASRVVKDLPKQVGSFLFESFRVGDISPNGRHLFYDACFRRQGSTFPCHFADPHRFLDLDSGSEAPLVGFLGGATSWSPDGARFAAVAPGDGDQTGDLLEVRAWTPDGRLQRRIELPRNAMAEIPAYAGYGLFTGPDLSIFEVGFSEPSWSQAGDELVVAVTWLEVANDYNAEYTRVYRVDVRTGGVEDLGFSEPTITRFSYHVSTWDGSRWVERGERHFSRHYSEREIDLAAVLPDRDGEYKVRIRQTGLEAAHVDRVLLRVGEGEGATEIRPLSVTRVPSGDDVLERVLSVDRDVLDLHEQEIEVRWPAPGDGETRPGDLRLALVAREEGFDEREARPFDYPAEGAVAEASYHHVVGSGAPMRVDGLQTGADGLAEPLFSTWSRPDTGHPAATVYGYAASDGEALYAALDFTVDNTEDGARDWASLWLRGAGGWREFRVTAADRAWGTVGFTRTGRVGHRHKYYEFRVPLAEIGAAAGQTVALRFQAYGTAALLPDSGLLPPYGDNVRWAPGEDKVLYSTNYSGQTVVIHLDEGNRSERVLEQFTTLNGAAFVAAGRKMLFRDGRDIRDPQSECYRAGGEHDHFFFDSLANDAVELAGEPTPDGRGIELSGTATDLHFARWWLEYADEGVPGFWTPIGKPETAPVVDETLTTWVPPGPGTYRVRLTVEDLAGNRRSASRLFSSASAASSLTDLSVAPRYVSPNGDGVQDAATVHYRVLAPVHLEIAVTNAEGDRVRTLRRDHSTIGTDHDVLWDGRNDAGLPVPDGRYRVIIAGYEFTLTVDTEPPALEGPELAGPWAVVGQGDGTYLALRPELRWCAADDNPDPGGALLSVGEGAAPSLWRPVQGGAVRDSCGPGPGAPEPLPLELDRFVGRRYRLEARDLAGNSASAASPLADEELFVYRWWPGREPQHDAWPSGWIGSDGVVEAEHRVPARLRVAETARETLSRLFVRFVVECDGSDPQCSGLWQEVEVTELFTTGGGSPATGVPGPELELVWDPSFLDPTLRYRIQLRGRTVGGSDVYSNVLLLRFGGERIVLEDLVDSTVEPEPNPGEPRPGATDLAIALGRALLDPAAGHVLRATETFEAALADVVLFLTSPDDPRFAAGRTLPLAGAAGEEMVFDGSDLLPCHTYDGIVLARAVLATGDTPVPLESQLRQFRMPCLAVEAQFEPVAFPACNTSPEPGRRLLLTPRSFDGVELTLLTVALGDPDDVTFSINRPQPDQPHAVEIDTAELPEGVHPLFVRLTNGEGAEAVQKVQVVVDRQPPAVRVTYPQDGERFCAETSAGGSAGVAIEGLLEDVAALTRQGGSTSAGLLQRRSPDGSWQPSLAPEWQPPTGATLLPDLALRSEDLVQRFEGSSGATTVRWVAQDLGGHRACSAPVTFSVDAAVGGTQALLERSLFSPNGDGFVDTTAISFSAAEAVVLDVLVYRGERRSSLAGDVVVPVGDPVRMLANALATAGGVELSWDGRSDGGGVVEDGLYAVVFRASDGCSNRVEISRGITVDLTPPQVEIVAPTSGEGLPLVVEVFGTALDPHFLDFTVEHGVGAEPFTWAPVARSSQQVRSGRLALWNTFALQGAQTLRLTARDLVGNESAHVVTLELPVNESLVTQLEASPDPFSPNGDGRRETTGVRFGFAQEVTASLAITTASGAPVRALASGEVFGAGAATRSWDGRDAAGERVPDGVYRVRLQAAATFDPSREQVETVPLVVDSTPPAIAVTRPREGFTPGAGHAVGSIEDPLLLDYVVEITATPDASDWREIGRGDTPVVAAEIGVLGGLAEGHYALRIRARDRAENRSELVVPFEVDDTAPEAALLAPAEGAVVGAAGGAVAIRGSVVEEHPHLWRLELGAGDDPQTWTELAGGEGLPSHETLLSWLPQGIADGTYTLRLLAEDRGGLTGTARASIEVDNTPPAVGITAPGGSVAVTAPVHVVGTAADPHLLVYQVEVSPSGAERWSEIGRSATAVSGGVLVAWRALPPDGAYRLRLAARDRAGNLGVTEVPVRVDTQPPSAPRGLIAVVENGIDGRLSWQPNNDADLAGYHVYRGGVKQTTALLPAPGYLEAALPEALHVYMVTAVDVSGLESPHSATAELLIDHSGPTAVIHRPRSGATVHGLVEVEVTAASDDFAEYRLHLAAADGDGPPLLLRSSPAPVRQQVVTTLSTAGLAEGSTHTLRLEATDVRGNSTTAEALLFVDNLAPATPTGLAVALTGDDATLTWNANAELDLAGYLLYRDGRLVHGSGDDLVRRAIVATMYPDANLPDGVSSWRLGAIDRAGNVSALTAPVTASVDQRAPHAVIVTPTPGTRFELPLYVLATTPDGDVAEVRFETRAAGAAEWTLLRAATDEPWETTWDPAGLAYGGYELRAVARDEGGRVDPAPTSVPLTYTELQRPAPVLGLAVRVDGGDAILSWTANGEDDLAGYHLDRVAAAGSPVRVTGSPVTGMTFTDSGLPDDTYEYTIVAVDVHDNESTPSEPRQARVYTPELVRPLSPTRAASTALRGIAASASQVTVAAVRPSGVESLPPATIDASGAFLVSGIGLELGANELSAVASDGAGNRSKPGRATVRRGSPPSAPTGVAATVENLTVSLSWNLNPEPDIRGYRVFIDGSPTSSDQLSRPTTAVASSQQSSSTNAARAIDGRSFTWWSPAATQPVSGQWIETRWTTPVLVSSVLLTWFDAGTHAVDYDLEVWDGTDWVRAFEVRGNAEVFNDLAFTDAYPTTGLRVILRTIAGVESVAEAVRLAGIDYRARPVVAAPPRALSVGHGVHELAVSAVNAFGFESDRTAIDVPVGDAEGPPAVVLGAAVEGADVRLTWTAAPTADLAYYLLYRDGEELAYHTDLANRVQVDAGRPNGRYRYSVVAVDQVGNAGPPSNEVEVTIASAPPPTPLALAVSDPGFGDVLDLTWQPGAGEPVAAGFRVLRSTVAGGPYEPRGETAASSWRDRQLIAGTTYYYVVAGLDSLGNAGATSNEASGTPADRTGPRPVLHFPAPPGGTFRTGVSVQELVAGSAEPGTAIAVERDGTPVGQTTASRELVTDTVACSQGWGEVRPSPDGSRAWLDDYFDHQLVDFASGEVRPAIGLSSTNVRWLADGRHVLGVVYDDDTGREVLARLRIADSTVERLVALDRVSVAVPSPDGGRALVAGQDGANVGLLLVDLESGDVSPLVSSTSAFDFEAETIAWSPSGTHVAYWRDRPSRRLEVLDVATGAVAVVPVDPANLGYPSWSPAGDAVAFGAQGDAGTSQVWIYRLGDGAADAVTTADQEHLVPRWSPDGASIAYVADGERIEVLDLESGQAKELYAFGDWWGSLAWAPGGRIVAVDGGAPIRITPAGRFEVRSVPLRVGENVFTAVGTDAVGNVGASEAPMVVEVVTTDDPDLAVTSADLAVFPSVPIVGGEVVLAATVTNRGTAESPAAEVTLLLVSPSGAPVPVASDVLLDPLAPGTGAEIRRTLVLPDAIGSWTLVAQVDPRDRIREADETNNRGERPFVGVGDEGPALFVTTDRPLYGSGENVGIRVELANAGPAFQGTLRLRIEDLDGFEVEELPPTAIDALGAGQVQEHRLSWNTGDTFAGGYRVSAELLDPNGVAAAAGAADFAVTSASGIAARVITDRAVYSSGEAVRITGTASHESGTATLTGLEARLSLLLDGVEVIEWSRALADLPPESEVSAAAQWPSAGAVVGSYRVRLVVFQGGVAVAVAETGFELTPASSGLTGTLALSDRVPAAGAPLAATFQIANGTPQARAALPVHLLVVDLASGSVRARHDETVHLASGQTVGGSATFATGGLTLGEHRVLLQVDLPASDSGVETVTLAAAAFVPVDETPPALRGLEPADGSYVATAGPALRAVVFDALSAVERVEVGLDAGPWRSAALESPAEGRWGRQATGLAEGAHRLDVRAFDAAGNEARAASAFTVDTTAPAVTVGGVEDGGSYPDPVTPRIDVVESHPALEEIRLDGAPFVSGTEVAAEGSHELRVTALDLAGNRTEVAVDFTVGTGEPDLVAEKVATLAVDADGDGLPSPGDVIAYTVTVANRGGAAATEVVLSDTIPAHAALVSGSVQTSPGTVLDVDPVTVGLGVLAAGGSATVSFRVAVDLPVRRGVDRIENQGVVTSAELPSILTDDPQLGGDADPTVTLLTAAPELVAEKVDVLAVDADGDGVPSPGDVLEYLVTVRNTGTTSATDVVLLDPTPLHGSLVAGSASASQGAVTEGDPLRATLGEIPGGGVAEVRLRVRIDLPIAAGVRELSNQGLVTSAELPGVATDDPEVDGAADPTLTAVSAAPDLLVEKTATLFADADADGVASPGDLLLYRVTVRNRGNTAATAVVLTDPLPEHTVLEPGTVQVAGGTLGAVDPITVDLGTVDGGEEVVVSFQARLADAFPLDVLAVANQAHLASAELPVVASDDPGTPAPADPTATEVFITPLISVAAAEADEAAGALIFTVTLAEASNRPVTVSHATVDVSAQEAHDFGATAGVSTFAPGETASTVSVPLLDDAIHELDETFLLRLAAPVGRVLGTAEAVGTIRDDDPPPFLSIADVTVDEGSSEAVLTLTLSSPSGLPVAVDWAAADDTARSGLDFGAAAGRATIAAGLTTATLAVPLVDDVLDEPNETFAVRLAPAVDAVVADGEARVRIADDDEPPLLAVRDVSVAEGDAGPAAAVFTLELSAPSGFDVAVAYATADGPEPGGARSGADYSAAFGDVAFPAGTLQQTVTVEVLGDALDEHDETFELRLGEPQHVLLPARPALGTIVDDDPLPALAIGDLTVAEGDTGSVQAVFPVRLSAPSGREVRVSWMTANGAAVAGADYVAASGTVVLPAGASEGAIVVEVLGDRVDEEDERFTVALSEPLQATVADGDGVGTVADDDPVPAVSIGDAEVVEGDAGSTTLRFPLTLSAASGRETRVTVTTSGGTAEPGEDYSALAETVVLPAGVTALDVVVSIAGDRVDEGDETVRVALSDPLHLVIARPSATGTIRDDDRALVSIDDTTVAEGDPGAAASAKLLFAVRLATAADREITVRYATAEGTATAGVDFEPAAGILAFAPGETAREVAVTVVPDLVLEPDEETLRVELSAPTETELANAEAAGTILDDELCPSPNLLANPGAEARLREGQIPAWQVIEGPAWQQRRTDPEPAEGDAYFFAGSVTRSELAQEVAVGAYEVRVDVSPGQRFAFSARVRTREESPPDTARVVVEYLDESKEIVLDAFDSGEVASPYEWREVADERAAPSGTRWIRVRLLATRFSPGDNDGYFDALSLRSLRTPVVSIGDATAYEGGSGNSSAAGDAVFPVALGCPFHLPVTVPFATADGTALAGADYSATSGVLGFPAGSTLAEVRVPVLADATHEPHETFSVALGTPGPTPEAALLDPLAIGLIVNDDFCARSAGFWKNHEEDWPTGTLLVGGIEHDAAALAAFLQVGGADASSTLARELVATKLNLLVGSDPYILPRVEEADDLLAVYPPGSGPQGEAKQLANEIKDRLEAYNNPDCPQTPVEP